MIKLGMFVLSMAFLSVSSLAAASGCGRGVCTYSDVGDAVQVIVDTKVIQTFYYHTPGTAQKKAFDSAVANIHLLESADVCTFIGSKDN